MTCVIYFDSFHRELEKMLDKYDIPHKSIQINKVSPSDYNNCNTIIIAGSKRRILRDGPIPLLDHLLTLDKQIIGICYGFQYMALKTGGKLGEFAKFKGIRLFNGIAMHYNHHDRVLSLPPKWNVINKVDNFINIAAINNWIGFQFHPEKTATNFETFLLPLL